MPQVPTPPLLSQAPSVPGPRRAARTPEPAPWWWPALSAAERDALNGRGPDELRGTGDGMSSAAEDDERSATHEGEQRAAWEGDFGGRVAGTRPPWVEFVEHALAHAPASAHGPGEPVRHVPESGPEGRLVHPLWPFLVAADVRFRQARVAGGPAEDGEERAVWAGARQWLAGSLVGLAARTLVAELRSSVARRTPAGDTPEERFDAVMRALAARPALGRVLRHHPVLARLLAERCLHAVDAAAELLVRFGTDRTALRARLLDGAPARIRAVRFGLGDPHAAGRTVAVLDLAGDRRLVYKPRPLGLHARWNDVLGWFAGHHPELAPFAVPVLPGDGYGWARFVPAAPCRSAAEVDAFYRRSGAQLALLYALDAVDVHAENVVAAGGRPAVVDVETLFHPCRVPVTDVGGDPAMAALAASVQRTAVLPHPLFGERGGLDISSLCAPQGGGSSAEPTVTGWADPGTDRMRPVRRPARWAGGENRPVLAGAAADPAAHLPALLDGFRAAYRTIAAHAAELTAPGGLIARCAAEPARLVPRASQTYAELLAASTEPHLLRELPCREAAFSALFEDTGHPELGRLAGHERADLVAGEIPVFTATPGSRTVRTAQGVALPDLLAESGLAAVRDKMARMSEADLHHQEWLIRASLATGSGAPAHRAARSSHDAPVWGDVRSAEAATAPRRDQVDPSALLAAAVEVGDDLVERCLRGPARANWLGLQPLDTGGWSVLPQGAGLGDGYPGTALFLAELAQLSGRGRFRDLAAEAVVGPLPLMLRLLAGRPELAAAVGPGGFDGVGGLAYATARLGNLLDSAELAAAVPDALTALTAAARSATSLGVADGLAGAYLAAEAVQAETGLPEAAELAAELARSLAGAVPGSRRPYAPGFLWGDDGVALALHTAYGPAGGRTTGGPTGDAWAGSSNVAVNDLSWCSGLAGAVLAGVAADGAAGARRTDQAPGASGPAAAALTARYLAAVADRAPLADHSLCHGELGVLEPLLELPDAADVRWSAAARLLRAVERHGPRCGTPGHVPTPGLLTGLAGVGHGLLRLAFGPQIPSVLLLRAAERPRPVEHEKGWHFHGQQPVGHRS